MWDGSDRLKRVEAPDGSVHDYGYDPFGRRVWKRRSQGGRASAPQRVEQLWSGDLLAGEVRHYADGRRQETLWAYEPGTFRPLAQERDGRLEYIGTDHLGTAREVFSEEGDLLWARRHGLWGGEAGVQRLRAANDNACPLRFQGQIEDEETGLYYNRFRYYDPSTGDYLSPDPIGLFGGFRPHGYVNDPTTWIDPWGLERCPKTISIVSNAIRRELDVIRALDPEAKVGFRGSLARGFKGNCSRSWRFCVARRVLGV